MKKTFYIILTALFCSLYFASNAFSQIQEEQKEKPSIKEKLFFGGGLGLSFGDVTYINIAPVIGYRITPKLSAGLRLFYQYRSYKDYYVGNGATYDSNDYGVGVFGRFVIFGPIYLQAEYEYQSYEYYYTVDDKQRQGYNSFMAGGGFMQPIGRTAAFYITAMYNFSYSNDSNTPEPYGSPLILRVGVTAGF